MIAKLLLVDVSNSFTKLALASFDRLLARKSTPTPELTPDHLHALLKDWQFDAVVVSSVVPEKTIAVRAAYPLPIVEVGPDTDLGVGIDYPNPASIGPDRLANAAGTMDRYGAPSVVVDFGTAVTFDILSSAGDYSGGVICPGLAAMTDYLHDKTALLPHIDLEEPESVIGKSTRQAMLAGAVIGYRGLVEKILHEIAGEVASGDSLKVIATGGYAELIAAKLPAITSVDPDLTLNGLRVIARRNLE